MTRLGERLIRRILEDGPISVADYMTACLHDPEDGYYATRPALGEVGDFITAPLVSQMFGELIGLWAAEVWRRMGAPASFVLAEFGPGDGTMMLDMLRASGAAAGFVGAAELWLVETSAPLRFRQATTLARHSPRWAGALAELPPDRPLIAVGNEFLDCLPIHQCALMEDGWRERLVGVVNGRLQFLVGRPAGVAGDKDSTIFEYSSELTRFGYEIGARIVTGGGAALFIDYGGDENTGDTLQSLRRHRRETPLHRPGEADLTARVDFKTFLAAAERAGASISPLETQQAFLTRLGLEQRAEGLRRLNKPNAARLDRQVNRLVSAGQMGELFKVACLHAPGLAPP